MAKPVGTSARPPGGMQHRALSTAAARSSAGGRRRSWPPAAAAPRRAASRRTSTRQRAHSRPRAGECCGDARDQPRGDLGLGHPRPVLDAAAGARRRCTVLSSPPMTPASGDTSLATIQSAPFVFSLAPALSRRSSVSAAKPITSRGRSVAWRPTVARMSGFSVSASGGGPAGAVLLDLASRSRVAGAPVGDRGGHDRDVGRQRRLDRGQHLARRLDMDHRRRPADRGSPPAPTPASPARRPRRRRRRWRGPAGRTSGWRGSAPGRSARGSGRR